MNYNPTHLVLVEADAGQPIVDDPVVVEFGQTGVGYRVGLPYVLQREAQLALVQGVDHPEPRLDIVIREGEEDLKWKEIRSCLEVIWWGGGRATAVLNLHMVHYQ